MWQILSHGPIDLALHPNHRQQLARQGHELSNHSVFHPCRRTTADAYLWLDEGYNLCTYSPTRLPSELEEANSVLEFIEGQTERTYGNTCCHTTIGRDEHEQPMAPILADLYIAAHSALTNAIVQPTATLNVMNVGCVAVDGRSFTDLIDIVQQAGACGGWAGLMIHGIGADIHDLHLDRETHAAFIRWLAQQCHAVRTTPFIRVTQHVIQHTYSDVV